MTRHDLVIGLIAIFVVIELFFILVLLGAARMSSQFERQERRR